MKVQSIFSLVSHLGCAVLGGTFVYRSLRFSRQSLWVRYAGFCLGAFLVVISLLLALGLVH